MKSNTEAPTVVIVSAPQKYAHGEELREFRGDARRPEKRHIVCNLKKSKTAVRPPIVTTVRVCTSPVKPVHNLKNRCDFSCPLYKGWSLGGGSSMHMYIHT